MSIEFFGEDKEFDQIDFLQDWIFCFLCSRSHGWADIMDQSLPASDALLEDMILCPRTSDRLGFIVWTNSLTVRLVVIQEFPLGYSFKSLTPFPSNGSLDQSLNAYYLVVRFDSSLCLQINYIEKLS